MMDCRKKNTWAAAWLAGSGKLRTLKQVCGRVTVVIIGNLSTEIVKGRMVSKRGYRLAGDNEKG